MIFHPQNVLKSRRCTAYPRSYRSNQTFKPKQKEEIRIRFYVSFPDYLFLNCYLGERTPYPETPPVILFAFGSSFDLLNRQSANIGAGFKAVSPDRPLLRQTAPRSGPGRAAA